MKFSRNFKRSEFECECGCGFDTVDHELVVVLEDLRRHLQTLYPGAYIVISGPNRCESQNEKIGGADDSQHLLGKAADIKAYWKPASGKRTAVPVAALWNYLVETYPEAYGVGLYSNRVHLDVRSKKARWTSL